MKSATPPGLCADCAFSRVVNNARGSRFYLCRRSETDPRYPKYPPLPVVRCPGYDRIGSSELPAPEKRYR